MGDVVGGVPVIHEDIWLPEVRWRHPDVLQPPVLLLVPLHVAVVPLLDRRHETQLKTLRTQLF